MKTRILVLFLLLATSVFSARVYAQVLVIAHPGVTSADVSKADLKDVFSGAAQSLKDGSHVVPVLLKGGTANDSFLSEYIGKPDSAFKATWRSLVFSGQASMPKTLDSEAAMVEYVAHTPGAVGYIGKSAPHEGVKVLPIR
jgi:ABC-type phosphate transport system substrate-binding protein